MENTKLEQETEQDSVVDKTEQNSDTTAIVDAVQKQNKKNSGTVSKRIEFDQKTMKRLNTMLPLYKDEVGIDMKDSELYSYVVSSAVNTLFNGDFKKKLEEL